MDNNSVQASGPAQAGHSSKMPSIGHDRHMRKKFSFKKLIKPLIIIVTIGLLLFGGFLLFKSATSSSIDANKYQAVHLVNGMNYYGKLQTLNGGYMKLTEIYYVQLKTGITEDEAKSALDLKNIELVKWGNEIQGPTDEMVINKDQIVSFENLKEDGKVVQAIKKYLAEN